MRMSKSLYFLFLRIKRLFTWLFLIINISSFSSSFCSFGSPSGGFESFCGSRDHPYKVDISLKYCRYLISALHTQASAASTYAVPTALATPLVQLRYLFIALGYV